MRPNRIITGDALQELRKLPGQVAQALSGWGRSADGVRPLFVDFLPPDTSIKARRDPGQLTVESWKPYSGLT